MSLLNDLKQINHEISLQEAIVMTTRFQKEIQSMLKPEYTGIDILPKSETFKKSIFVELVRRAECAAIRSYLGMDENNHVRLIFVGVDDNNNDILASGHAHGGHIFEYGQRCPPICGISPLNP